MEVHGDRQNPDLRIVDAPFGEFTDLVSFTQYIGWYDGLPDLLSAATPVGRRLARVQCPNADCLFSCCPRRGSARR
jgi:hypothetical protein